MTATKEKEITVPIPLSQLEEMHDIWLHFSSMLDIAEEHDGCHVLATVLRPLDSRMMAIVVEQWEDLMEKAKKERREGS